MEVLSADETDDFGAEDGEAQYGHETKDARDFAVGLDALAQADEEGHPDDDDVEEGLEPELAGERVRITRT